MMKAALEQGANFWNGTRRVFSTALPKPTHCNFNQYPEDADKVVLSIKGAFAMKTGPSGSAEALGECIEEADKVLNGSKMIDVFDMARVDPNVPVETSVKALAELVKEGNIGGIGLSEVSANTIRKAHAVHGISAVEIELSLFTPDPLSNGIADGCHELGIPMIAYSPISRGWLTDSLRKPDDLADNDFRRMLPRFQAGAFDQNVKLVEALEKIAKRKGLTTSQVATAWVCRQGAVPIPASTKLERVVENSKAVSLTNEDMADMQTILDTIPVAGGRYGSAHEKLLNA